MIPPVAGWLSDNQVLHRRPEWALALLGSTDEKELSPSN
jgi:hypothetical protein